jgi:tRNA modification GTPase
MVIYMPMSEPDTICAVSTPPGDGGIGIIRVSGRNAVEIASRLFRSQKEGTSGPRRRIRSGTDAS